MNSGRGVRFKFRGSWMDKMSETRDERETFCNEQKCCKRS